MAHLSKIFEDAPIKVQNKNGFDLSHVHSGSSKCGQLVPVLTKLLPPNTTVSLGVNAEVNLPPIVAPFYGKVDFAIEGFIVPCSILYGGWKQFISNNDINQFPANQVSALGVGTDGDYQITSNTSPIDRFGYALPFFSAYTIMIGDIANFGTLEGTNDNIYSYMGFNMNLNTSSPGSNWSIAISLLPGLAYHKICDVFYRNTKLTKTWFAVNPNSGMPAVGGNVGASGAVPVVLNSKNVSLVWHSFYSNPPLGNSLSIVETTSPEFSSAAELTFPDSVSFFSTRQRQYMRDYFTSAVPSPQQGGASTLKFSVDVSTAGSEFGSFTINSLRMANSLQKFLETNNLSGEYADMMRNRWGVRPIDADFDEPHYLGRVVVPVYQHTIFQNAANRDLDPYTEENPFIGSGLGASASVGKANAEGSICDNFLCSTWSYLMCIASLYPHANYNYGLNRELTMTKLGDFPAPELQSVGMEEIKNYELTAQVNTTTAPLLNRAFGYTQRYSRFKYIDDHTSGELRPGKTLFQYQMQRHFSLVGVPALGTSFVEIPQNAMDSHFVVSTAGMKLTCWWEIFFKLRVSMPLADYCIPTLGELGDSHTIHATQGGSRLT